MTNNAELFKLKGIFKSLQKKRKREQQRVSYCLGVHEYLNRTTNFGLEPQYIYLISLYITNSNTILIPIRFFFFFFCS